MKAQNLIGAESTTNSLDNDTILERRASVLALAAAELLCTDA